MKKNLFLMIAVLAASPVMGQDAKQIADSLSIHPVKAGAKQLPEPRLNCWGPTMSSSSTAKAR